MLPKVISNVAPIECRPTLSLIVFCKILKRYHQKDLLCNEIISVLLPRSMDTPNSTKKNIHKIQNFAIETIFYKNSFFFLK